MKISWQWKFRLQVYGAVLVSIGLFIALDILIPRYREEDVRETARLIADNLVQQRCANTALPRYDVHQCIMKAQEEATALAKKEWEEWEKLKRMELWQKLTR